MTDIAQEVAGDMLAQAEALGMQVGEPGQETHPYERAQANLNANAEALAQIEGVPNLPTPAEEIVEEAQAEVEETFIELPSFSRVPEEEFAGFEEEEAESTMARLSEILQEDEQGFSEIEDADELRAELHKLRGQLNYQKELRAKSQRSAWEKEAKEKYPLADVSGISAQSRNAFLKQAASSHNANLDHLSPYFQELEDYRKKLVEVAKAEGKKEAVAAWGKPTTQPTVGEMDDASYEAGLAAVRKTGNLEKIIRYMRESGRGGRA